MITIHNVSEKRTNFEVAENRTRDPSFGHIALALRYLVTRLIHSPSLFRTSREHMARRRSWDFSWVEQAGVYPSLLLRSHLLSPRPRAAAAFEAAAAVAEGTRPRRAT